MSPSATGRRDPTSFDEVAELYDEIRPGYPPELIDDLVQIAGLDRRSRVLEIGCGTGKLTAALAGRVGSLIALEPGGNLAAVARWKLKEFRHVEVVVNRFEDWTLPAEPFQLVVAAASFHWLDPRVRFAKSAQALGAVGDLAVIETHHIAGGTQRFFEESQACYERFDLNTRPGFRLPPAADIPEVWDEARGVTEFKAPALRRYEFEIRYSTAEYRKLLLTFSDHRAMEEKSRDGLLECLGTLIDRHFGGSIVKRHLRELRVARKWAA